MNRLYTAIVAGLLLTVCGCRGNEYEEVWRPGINWCDTLDRAHYDITGMPYPALEVKRKSPEDITKLYGSPIEIDAIKFKNCWPEIDYASDAFRIYENINPCIANAYFKDTVRTVLEYQWAIPHFRKNIRLKMYYLQCDSTLLPIWGIQGLNLLSKDSWFDPDAFRDQIIHLQPDSWNPGTKWSDSIPPHDSDYIPWQALGLNGMNDAELRQKYGVPEYFSAEVLWNGRDEHYWSCKKDGYNREIGTLDSEALYDNLPYDKATELLKDKECVVYATFWKIDRLSKYDDDMYLRVFSVDSGNQRIAIWGYMVSETFRSME